MNARRAGDFKLMSPKIDFAFKEIMRNEKARIGFLSAVLGIPVEQIKETVIRNPELPRMHEGEKQGILDVKLTLNNDTVIDIEIQLSYMKTWAERSAFYVARMLSEQENVNHFYTNLKKCIGINILDFRYIQGTERFHTVYHVREDSEPIRFTDVMEWHIVELPKLPKADDGTKLYQWARFISAEREEEFEMLAKTDEYLGAAVQQLEVISQDERMRNEYTARMKAIMDYNTQMAERYAAGKEEGRAEGAADKAEQIANRLRAMGMSEDQIAQIIGGSDS